VSNVRYSIIIPVYNTALYLEECINSILKHNNSYEIIIINDGSIDNSAEIIKKFEDNSKVKCFFQDNQGLSSTRNNGLNIAKGEYIYFLDSDDYISDDFFEVLDDLILLNNPDIILFSAQPFFETKLNNLNGFNYSRYPVGVMESGEYFDKALKSGKYFVQACMYIFKRDVLKDLRFIPGILHEDNIFTTQLLLNNEKLNIISIQDKLYNRRFRDNSIMTSNVSIKNFEGYYTGVKVLSDFNFSKNNSKNLKCFIEKLYLSALFCLLVVNDFKKNQAVKEYVSISNQYLITYKGRLLVKFIFLLKFYPFYKKLKSFSTEK